MPGGVAFRRPAPSYKRTLPVGRESWVSMLTTPNEIAPVLKSLIETCKDGQEGFRTAAEGIENDPRLKSFLSSCSEQRARFVGELENELRKLGDYSTESSSIAGTLHRGWINLKSALTTRDPHAVLSECERGEDSALKQYQEALNAGLPALLDAIVARQRQEIVVTHSAVRDARDANPSLGGSGGGFVQNVQEKGRDLAASASDTFENARAGTSRALSSGTQYARENPTPVILAAFGLGFVIALLIRLYQHHEEEEKTSRKIERAYDRAAEAVDVRPYVLPLVWPLWKALRGGYQDTSKTVQQVYKDSSKSAQKAYKNSSKSARKAYSRAAEAVEDAVEDLKDIDVSKHVKPVVKKIRGLF